VFEIETTELAAEKGHIFYGDQIGHCRASEERLQHGQTLYRKGPISVNIDKNLATSMSQYSTNRNKLNEYFLLLGV